jgi:hypothetical protein
MQVSHLKHSDLGICCSRCKQLFPVHRRVLEDAHKLLAAKEGIASRHCCGRKDGVQRVIPIRTLSSNNSDSYWTSAVRNATIAQMRGAQ